MASLLELQPALAQSSQVDPGVRLQAGIEKEDVDGDLKSAMMSIRKSPLMYWRHRDVRARALLRRLDATRSWGTRRSRFTSKSCMTTRIF
jgi:hypothetical protein